MIELFNSTRLNGSKIEVAITGGTDPYGVMSGILGYIKEETPKKRKKKTKAKEAASEGAK